MRVEVRITGGESPGTGAGVLDAGAYLGTLPGPDDVHVVPAEHLPAWVAAAAGLGPRPVPDVRGLLLADRADVDALVAGDTAVLGAVPDSWAGAVAALAGSPCVHWSVTAGDVRLEVVDAGDAGLWAVGANPDEPGRASLAPTSAGDVWLRLATLARGAAAGQDPG